MTLKEQAVLARLLREAMTYGNDDHTVGSAENIAYGFAGCLPRERADAFLRLCGLPEPFAALHTDGF